MFSSYVEEEDVGPNESKLKSSYLQLRAARMLSD